MPIECNEGVVHAIVSTVAEARDLDPVELPPLSQAIDPDSLVALLTPSGSRDGSSFQRVRFDYAGYDVTVFGDGTVELGSASRPVTN